MTTNPKYFGSVSCISYRLVHTAIRTSILNIAFVTYYWMSLYDVKKQPNRLAKLIDHQAFAGSALPETLNDNMRLYVKTTDEIKELLVDCLPEEILNSCWVVGFTSEQLTLSVGSITAANHIRYLQSAYLQVLTKQSITFKQLKKIRVVVTSKSADSHSPKHPSGALSEIQKANENQGLSQNIKRTISQAAERVTTDKDLKNALLRLANP